MGQKFSQFGKLPAFSGFGAIELQISPVAGSMAVRWAWIQQARNTRVCATAVPAIRQEARRVTSKSRKRQQHKSLLRRAKTVN
jgi:hypothetical protein